MTLRVFQVKSHSRIPVMRYSNYSVWCYAPIYSRNNLIMLRQEKQETVNLWAYSFNHLDEGKLGTRFQDFTDIDVNCMYNLLYYDNYMHVQLLWKFIITANTIPIILGWQWDSFSEGINTTYNYYEQTITLKIRGSL